MNSFNRCRVTVVVAGRERFNSVPDPVICTLKCAEQRVCDELWQPGLIEASSRLVVWVFHAESSAQALKLAKSHPTSTRDHTMAQEGPRPPLSPNARIRRGLLIIIIVQWAPKPYSNH